jgi:hypothetical protein
VKLNGLIKPDSKIYIQSKVSFEPKSAQGSIQLRGVQGIVKLDDDDKLAIWEPVTPIPEGYYTFEIGELIFVDGTKQESAIQIPLLVLDSKAQISNDLTVHNISRVEIKGTKIKRIPLGSTRGNYVEMIKALDKNGRPIDLAYDKKGNQVDAKKIMEDHDKEYVKKYGKIHESLYEELNKKKREKDLISVAIWLDIKQRNFKLKDKTRQESDEDKKLRKNIQIKGREFSNKIKRKFKSETVRIDDFAPVVYTTLTKGQVLYLAKDGDVSRIFLHEPEGIEDLQDSINIANSDIVQSYGVNGSNVRVAVWEDGPDIENNLVISELYDTSRENRSEHARLTTAIIRNSEMNNPNGHAPSCIIHSANNKDTDALRWAVRDMQCTVVSQSFHRASEAIKGTLSFDDILKDYLVLHWPHPTILQAAGNYWNGDPDNINPPEDEYVNHKGYNSLAIGNHDDLADNMDGSSVFRNPSSPHGDRELPELSANGTAVAAVGLKDTGTSFAAPAVAGITALIQEADPELQIWPEGCRAILLAGANRSVTGGTWWNDVSSGIDSKDGAGAANAYNSYAITENRVHRNGIAERGWDVGKLSSGDFDSNRMSRFTYRVRTPISGGSLFARVKIALAWDSLTWLTFTSILTLDLDLLVYDSNNNLISSSESYDNSYEIAEFRAQANRTYTIKIRRRSGSNDTWFGIAWNVYGFLVSDPGWFPTIREVSWTGPGKW